MCSPDKKRYRESYISDEGSPRLSRQSTCSSGIEVDAQHHGSISMEMASVETAASAEGGGAAGRRRAEKRFSSAASHGSSHTSGVDVGGVKARTDDEEEEEEEVVVVEECPGEGERRGCYLSLLFMTCEACSLSYVFHGCVFLCYVKPLFGKQRFGPFLSAEGEQDRGGPRRRQRQHVPLG